LLFKAAKIHGQMTPRATWPQADARPAWAKNRVSTTEHHRPKGWERYVERICQTDCVSYVRADPSASRGGAHVRIVDPEKGVTGLRYEAVGTAMALSVETTARGAAQTELVGQYPGRLK